LFWLQGKMMKKPKRTYSQLDLESSVKKEVSAPGTKPNYEPEDNSAAGELNIGLEAESGFSAMDEPELKTYVGGSMKNGTKDAAH